MPLPSLKKHPGEAGNNPHNDVVNLDSPEFRAFIIGELDRLVALLKLLRANSIPLAARQVFAGAGTQKIYTALQRVSMCITSVSATAAVTVTLTISGKNVIPGADSQVFIIDLPVNGVNNPYQEFIIPRDATLSVTVSAAATVCINGIPYQLPDQSLVDAYRI